MNRTILLGFILWANCSIAQQVEKTSRSIIIQNNDMMIEASALVGEDKINISDDLTYHWFRNNKIHQTKGGFDGDIMHGDYTSFYPSKELKEKGTFNKGVKHGMWKSWHENGEISEIITWKNGVKNGAYMQYSSTGILLLQSTYKNGLLHGKMVSYQAGRVLNETLYENGKKIEKVEEPANGKKKKKAKAPKSKKVKSPKKKKNKNPEIKPPEPKEENNGSDDPKKS